MGNTKKNDAKSSDHRTEREAKFHDRAFTEDVRASTAKFYSVTVSSKGYYLSRILENCAGQEVLEIGCGPGGSSGDLAAAGATITGVDISANAVELAKQQAIAGKFDDRASYHVMDAEALEFQTDKFDLVCGCGIVHHLDIESGLSEVVRVLKPGGRAVFYEPLGHNPLINLYRKLTPSKRSEDEHPLHWKDIKSIRRRFTEAEFRVFHLLSLLTIPIRSLPGHNILFRLLEGVDRILFWLPFLKKHAWVVVMQFRNPIKTGPCGQPRYEV